MIKKCIKIFLAEEFCFCEEKLTSAFLYFDFFFFSVYILYALYRYLVLKWNLECSLQRTDFFCIQEKHKSKH